jgi:hypothetical protein
MAYLLVALTLSAPPASSPSKSPQAKSPQDGQLRGYHQLNDDLRDWMRREARAETRAERATAIRALCALHGELAADPRRPTSPTLQRYRAKLWKRLTAIKQELNREIARQERRSASGRGGADTLRREGSDASLADATAARRSSLGVRRAAAAEKGARAGGPYPPDDGPALVALIEQTINPAFWDVKGGPGTIVYYAPLRAIVVRATTRIHEEIEKILRGLRSAK